MRERISGHRYLVDYVNARQAEIWERPRMGDVFDWLRESGVNLKSISETNKTEFALLRDMGIKFRYNRDAKGIFTLNVEIPGAEKNSFYLRFPYRHENDPYVGALFLSQDSLTAQAPFADPEHNWLRKINLGDYGLSFVFGTNPKEPDGKDMYFITYEKFFKRSVGKID